jgi:uncharacterized OB-fold protein
MKTVEMPKAVEPMSQKMAVQFPYKHSTGEVTGRFLAGLKEQKKIWGRRVSQQGVVVPPNAFSEVDAKEGGEWAAVANVGTVTAVAEVTQPVEGLHPSKAPFAFVLVKLDGADTALAHIVTEDLASLKVGSRVEAVWAPDDQRTGTIRDIACFRLVR